MMTIGEFARAGEVSVRMLRHYDRIGLLRPDRVDEWTGHRFYEPAQLGRLDRLVALKELGFSLAEVGELLPLDLSGAEFAQRLRGRRAELAAEVHAASTRLHAVNHRLHLIERTHDMSEHDFTTRTIDPVRLVGLPISAASQPEVSAVVGPLFGRVADLLARAGGRPDLGIATYQDAPDGALSIFVGFASELDVEGLEVRELEAVEALTTLHLGSMEGISESWGALTREVTRQGRAFAGACREVYLEASDPDDQSGWVTELQQPVR